MINQQPISVAFTVNDAYAQHCCVAMVSALANNLSESFDFYILTDYFSDTNKELFRQTIQKYGLQHNLKFIIVDNSEFQKLRLNIGHISLHTYYRFMLPSLLPDVDKLLYLDADLFVHGAIDKLWATDLDNAPCAGVRDHYVDPTDYKVRIGFLEDHFYFNAGVLLLNLKLLRQEQSAQKFIDISISRGEEFDYQDQDVLNIAFQGRVVELPFVYNYTEARASEQKMVKPIIVHFPGQRKPWNPTLSAHNPLAKCYFDYLKLTPYRSFRGQYLRQRILRNIKKVLGLNFGANPIKVALVIDEYFGACGTAFGGYGFLARQYIARYLPYSDIKVEVLLRPQRSKLGWFARRQRVDRCDVIAPPRRQLTSWWLNRQNYDLYLTIELTHDILKYERKQKPIIHWIQDPRPWSDWEEIQTVKLFPEGCYWASPLYDFVHNRYLKGSVTFVSQGHFLNPKAKQLYRLPESTPISYMPNPVDIDYRFDAENYPKKNHILFIGRIESVKRGWLFCELAKMMPQYEFFMLGQTFREQKQNESVMGQYRTGISNLHFVGHVEGEQKASYIRDAKILVNTSIHEALPITFLEALAYGTLLVSCQNPDELTSKFGRFVGPVLGDGFDKLPLFVEAVESLMSDESLRKELSVKAVAYIRNVHPVYKFRDNMRQLVKDIVAQERAKQ